MTMLKNAFRRKAADNDCKRDGGLPLNSPKTPPATSGWKVVRLGFMQGARPAYYDAPSQAWYHTIDGNSAPLPGARVRDVVGWREE
jgi:hypothetical protein